MKSLDIAIENLPEHLQYLGNDIKKEINQAIIRAADERALYIATYLERYNCTDPSKEIKSMYDLRYLLK